MSTWSKNTLRSVGHYGSLSLFFAVYLSTCYALVSFFFVATPAQPAPADTSRNEPQTVQSSELASVVGTGIDMPVIDHTPSTDILDTVSTSIPTVTTSSDEVTQEVTSSETPIDSPALPFAGQSIDSLVRLVETPQLIIENLLRSF